MTSTGFAIPLTSEEAVSAHTNHPLEETEMPSGNPDFTLSASDQPPAANERPFNPLPTRYLELARQTVSDAGETSLNNSRFLLVVESALAAIHLVFAAALHEPAEWELDILFETFVGACILPCSGGRQ